MTDEQGRIKGRVVRKLINKIRELPPLLSDFGEKSRSFVVDPKMPPP